MNELFSHIDQYIRSVTEVGEVCYGPGHISVVFSDSSTDEEKESVNSFIGYVVGVDNSRIAEMVSDLQDKYPLI